MKPTALILGCSLLWGIGHADPTTLKLTRTVPLPSVQGRFDHFAIDVPGRRLFVAALGNNTLEVLDIAAGSRLRTVSGLSKPTGVLYLAGSNRIGVANGDEGSFKLFDGRSYTLLQGVGKLEDADNTRFDPQAGVVYVGYGSGALGIVDPAAGRQTGAVKLPAHPESFQLEKLGSRIFVNVPEAGQVIVIDRQKRAVVATWPMGGFKANFPMALDEAHGRLFVGCRQPPKLVVLDTSTGKRTDDLTISGDTDDLFYDAVRERVYLSCGEGYLDVVDAPAGGPCQRRDRIPTARGARTSWFAADLDEFYLAVPRQGSRPAEVRIYKPQAP